MISAAPFLLLLMSQRALLSITTTTTLRRSWKRPGKKYFRPDAPDLYPEALRDDIDALNDIIYADVNLAVNLTAFVTSQKDYEFYYNKVFDRLDWLEKTS